MEELKVAGLLVNNYGDCIELSHLGKEILLELPPNCNSEEAEIICEKNKVTVNVPLTWD